MTNKIISVQLLEREAIILNAVYCLGAYIMSGDFTIAMMLLDSNLRFFGNFTKEEKASVAATMSILLDSVSEETKDELEISKRETNDMTDLAKSIYEKRSKKLDTAP